MSSTEASSHHSENNKTYTKIVQNVTTICNLQNA